MPDSLRPVICHAILITVVGFALHLVWENIQCRIFFEHRANPANQWSMLLAAGGDVILTWIAWIVAAAVTGRWLWLNGRWTLCIWMALLGSALVLSVSIELYALSVGRWIYTDINPRIPLIEVSIIPVLQLLLLFPITFGLTRAWGKYVCMWYRSAW
jgi:hypothetical protein